MLVETARCVSAQERSNCLPPDCTDFLRGVDNMEVSSAIPAALPDEHWPALCRARRFGSGRGEPIPVLDPAGSASGGVTRRSLCAGLRPT